MRARFVTACLAGLLAFEGVAPGLARAQGATPAVDADTRDRSRAAFRKGVAQLRVQDWAGARASFETAWSLYPHPSILLNLGIARSRTDDPIRAEQDFVRFLSEDFGASAEELAAAREALAEVRAKIGTLKIAVSPASARVSLDGRAVETVRRTDPSGGTDILVAEVRVKPGRHAVAVDAEGYVASTKEVEVAAKADLTVSIVLPAAESKKPAPVADAAPSPARAIVGWSLVGLAGVGLATGVVCAVSAKSLSDDYSDPTNPGFQSPDTKSEGVAFRTTADVAFGVAIAAGAAAVILLLTDVGKGSPAVAKASRWGAPVLHW
ncbi:MAG: hypothetical protein JST00_44600 [Deltaproteobacteria bacterium]|nr:hypothetical protein [Deltaproteobacteria bacterium]